MSFTKNVFMAWFQGCDKIEKAEYRTNLRLWKLLNPEWNVQCVSTTEMRAACAGFSERCASIYDQLCMQIQIDLGRLALIHQQGGFYVDMDAYVMRPLSTNEPLNQLIEQFEKKEVQHILTVSKMMLDVAESAAFCQHKFCVNNAIVCSSAGNPIIAELINKILDKSEALIKKGHDFNTLRSVLQVSGPPIFAKFLMTKISNPPKGVKILTFEPAIFEPCPTNNSPCFISKDTIAVHQYENSWVGGYSKKALMVYGNYKRDLLYVLCFFLFLFVYYKTNFFNFLPR